MKQLKSTILLALVSIVSPGLSQPNYPTRIVQEGVYYYCFTVEQSEDLLNKIANVNQRDSLVQAQDSLIIDLQEDINKADSVIDIQERQISSDSIIIQETEVKYNKQQELTGLCKKEVAILEDENKQARRRTIIVGILGGLFTGAAIIFE
jgi:uncharacterized protein (DUF3084 family)